MGAALEVQYRRAGRKFFSFHALGGLPSAHLPLIAMGAKHQEKENTEMSMLR